MLYSQKVSEIASTNQQDMDWFFYYLLAFENNLINIIQYD